MPEHMSFPLCAVGEAATAELTGQALLQAGQTTAAAAAAARRRNVFWEMEIR